MKMLKSIVFLTAFSTALALPLTAEEDGNIFPEGAFEMSLGDGLPEGWGVPDKNDLPWKAGTILTLEEEEGGTFARITTTTDFPGFYALSAVVPIPEGTSMIRVSARLRAELEIIPGDWSGFKVHVGFSTEAGPGPGIKDVEVTNDRMAFSLQESTPDWKEMESAFEVPEGATFACVTVLVGSMLGTFDIDDVKIFAE